MSASTMLALLGLNFQCHKNDIEYKTDNVIEIFKYAFKNCSILELNIITFFSHKVIFALFETEILKKHYSNTT